MSNQIEKAQNTNMPAEMLDQLKEAQKELISNEESFGSSGIQFINTAGNKLSLDSVDFPGNALACLILDSIGVNALYTQKYNRDVRTSPKCFAFSRNKQDFAPNEHDVTERQADMCENCKMQEWGSAATEFPNKPRMSDAAKACSSKRRLAIVCCGEVSKDGGVTLFRDGNDLKESINSEILFLDVSVTSVKNYKNYAIKMNTKHKGEVPLFCIPTKISLVPDEKNQRTILFEEIKTSLVDGEEAPAAPIRDVSVVSDLLERHQEAKALIATPWPKVSEEEKEDTSNAKFAVRQAHKKQSK